MRHLFIILICSLTFSVNAQYRIIQQGGTGMSYNPPTSNPVEECDYCDTFNPADNERGRHYFRLAGAQWQVFDWQENRARTDLLGDGVTPNFEVVEFSLLSDFSTHIAGTRFNTGTNPNINNSGFLTDVNIFINYNIASYLLPTESPVYYRRQLGFSLDGCDYLVEDLYTFDINNATNGWQFVVPVYTCNATGASGSRIGRFSDFEIRKLDVFEQLEIDPDNYFYVRGMSVLELTDIYSPRELRAVAESMGVKSNGNINVVAQGIIEYLEENK